MTAAGAKAAAAFWLLLKINQWWMITILHVRSSDLLSGLAVIVELGADLTSREGLIPPEQHRREGPGQIYPYLKLSNFHSSIRILVNFHSAR